MKPINSVSIFESGYLKSEYLNTENYSSTTGFEVEVFGETFITKKLKSISNGICFFSDGTVSPVERVKIPEFDVLSIPGGEFVWLKGKSGRWNLRRSSTNPANSKNFTPTLVVPLLIAQTARHAMKIERWDNE